MAGPGSRTNGVARRRGAVLAPDVAPYLDDDRRWARSAAGKVLAAFEAATGAAAASPPSR